RFPLVLGIAALATLAGLGTTIPGSPDEFTRLLVAATLGLPLLFALTLVGERFAAGSSQRWLGPFGGVVLLFGVWFMWTGWSSPIQTLRYIQLSVAFHLFAAFAPYVASTRPNGFWQYNKLLFLRALTAWLYTMVLFAGLSIALVAIDKLFGVTIP